MNNNIIFVAYYVYAAAVVLGTGYVVFGLGRSGWWFLMAILLLQIQPEIKEKKRSRKRRNRSSHENQAIR